MLPAAMTPESVYKNKRIAYDQLQTGCHWPNREEWFQTPHHNVDFRPYFRKPPQLSLWQQQLYGLVRYTGPSLEQNLTSPLHHEMTQVNDASSNIESENNNEAKPLRKAQRRWGRISDSTEASVA